jgi:hypothetical protein
MPESLSSISFREVLLLPVGDISWQIGLYCFSVVCVLEEAVDNCFL